MSNFLHEDLLMYDNGPSASITTKDWMKLDCIQFLSIIPVLGTIAAIVIYIILALNNETPKSMKTRLRANIIWALISLILVITFCIILLVIYMFSLK